MTHLYLRTTLKSRDPDSPPGPSVYEHTAYCGVKSSIWSANMYTNERGVTCPDCLNEFEHYKINLDSLNR